MVEILAEELDELKRDLGIIKSTLEELIQFASQMGEVVGNQINTMMSEFKKLEERVQVLEKTATQSVT